MTLKESIDKLKERIEKISDEIESLDTSDEFDEVSTYLEYIRIIHNHIDVIAQDLTKKLDSNLEILIATQTVQTTHIEELKDQITRLFEHKESINDKKSPEDRLNQEIARVLFTTSETTYDYCAKEANNRIRAKEESEAKPTPNETPKICDTCFWKDKEETDEPCIKCNLHANWKPEADQQ